MQKIITKSDLETKNFAKNFAKTLKGGEVILLYGDLGAGKTTFAQGLAEGLGVKDKINSPTFVILKEYHIQKADSCKLKAESLIHVDCYRFKNYRDAFSVGLTDYLGKADTICVIEWPEKIKQILPKKVMKINIEHLNENSRQILINNPIKADR